jgi:hypothetical protein
LRFAAGFGEELLGAETLLNGNMGEQEPALMASRNQQTVAANFDLFEADGKRRKEQRYFNAQSAEFLGTHSGEARVLQRGAGGTTHNAIA